MRYVDIVAGLLAVVTEIGVGSAVIYLKEDSQEFLSTAWLISFSRGCLMFLATFFLATPLAGFFNEPLLAPILRVMAFSNLISGMNSIGLFLLQRDLDFRKLTWLEIGVNVISLFSSIIAAFFLRNTWALVIGVFTQLTLMLIGSYILRPVWPRLTWSRKSFRSIFSYGRFILGADIINYLLNYGDNAIVGKLLGSEQLGLYALGYDLANMPTTSITHVIGKVAFPTYAKLNTDIPLLRKTYFKVLKLISLAAVPVVGLMLVLANQIIEVIYGPKWMPMAPAFTWLCVYGLERAINAPVGPLFKALGTLKYVIFLISTKLALLLLFIFPLTISYGITGTGMAGGLVAILLFANTFWLSSKVLQCKIKDIIGQLTSAFIATFIMAAILLLVSKTLLVAVNLLTLIVLVLIGMLIYLLALYLIDREVLTSFTLFVKTQFQETK